MQAVNGNNTFLVGCVLAGTAQVAPCQYYAVASVVVEAGPLGKDWKLFNITNSKCALQPTQFKLVARLGAELLKTLKDQVATLAIWKSSVNFGSRRARIAAIRNAINANPKRRKLIERDQQRWRTECAKCIRGCRLLVPRVQGVLRLTSKAQEACAQAHNCD